MISIAGWVAFNDNTGPAIDTVFATREEAFERAGKLANALFEVHHVVTGFKYFKISEAAMKAAGWGVRQVVVVVGDESKN